MVLVLELFDRLKLKSNTENWEIGIMIVFPASLRLGILDSLFTAKVNMVDRFPD